MSRTARRPVSFGWRRTTAMLVAVTVLLAPLTISSGASATAATDRGPSLTHLVHFGSGLGSGSTIGPDGALYVTDGTAGSVKRVDRHTGAVSVYATGLPPRVLGIGGAVDVAFLDGHGYALVTMVGGDFVGGPHIGDAVVGIYRLDSGDHPTPIANIGAWSIAHPPTWASASPPACSTHSRRTAVGSSSPTGTTTGCSRSPSRARSPRSRPSPTWFPRVSRSRAVGSGSRWPARSPTSPRRDGSSPWTGAPSRRSSRRAPACSSTWSSDRSTSCMPCRRACGTALRRGRPLFLTPGGSLA